jgi:manganese/iron transport system permease protein
MLVGPALSAYLLVKELHQMMMLGAIIGAFDSIAGVYISYYFNIPSGPAIVLVSSCFFVLTLLFSPSQGILVRSDSTKHS